MHDPGGVVTGPGSKLAIADRGWTRSISEVACNVNAETSCRGLLAIVLNRSEAGMTDIEQHGSVQVFIGVDVGKGTHHAVALDRKGKRILDSALPDDEMKLRALIGKLKEHGPILLVVDQPATSARSRSR